MVNFNSKYTILVIVLVALALLFAIWKIWKIYKIFLSSKVNPIQQYASHNNDGTYIGGRKRRHTKKKVNKK